MHILIDIISIPVGLIMGSVFFALFELPTRLLEKGLRK